ncbi:tetratricopeptide repeat protein [Ciceribacter sp. L1K22]|uniref:tetratricopeptide repeat protein n=1 Tax=Ciceribacter sp. L1K22 TaxID=2820275 RepID=UPI001ABEC552|nr:tetratricopeptide repeat protein [Ciceribacter sp. L1K22]MBO3761703.1 tetratricopeptide repeat protein [Ciceribacter sp. L1K22]
MISIEERLAAAAAHQSEGRFDSALMLYQLVLDVNPRHRHALKAIAGIFADQGRSAEALEAISAAVALAPDDVDALALLARCAERSGEPERAVAAIDQIVLLDPNGVSTARLRSERAAALGDPAASERILVEALRQEPQNTELISALSRLYFAGGMVEDALSLAERATALAPEDASCHALLASQLLALGDHRGALHRYERALLLAPADIAVLIDLVECHANCGELSEARRLAARAIAIRPDLLVAWRAHVRVEILRGEGEAALKRFSEVARAHPNRIDALICLADCYRLSGAHTVCLKLLAPLADRVSPVQALLVDGLRRESSLALGDFKAAAATLANLDAFVESLASDVANLPITVSIPPTTSSIDIVPLLRLAHLAKVGRPVEWTGSALFSDIAALVPGMSFRPVAAGTPAPPGISLPALIGLADISPEMLGATVPYLEPPVQQRAIWRAALAEFPRPLVALAWNAERPGLLLDDLRPILGEFSGTFISVVWDEGRHQLSAFPHVIDAGAHMAGMADVAAAIAECDFVLAPDCVPLHLAGAMGVRGLALTQPNAVWYWFAKDDRSVWYPSIEVAQTRCVGPWAVSRDEVIADIRRCLDDLASPSVGIPVDTETVDEEVA